MFSKKGISTIIAVILVLLMTIAGAAAAFFWFNRVQSQMQGGTESYSEGLSTKIASRIEIAEVDAYFNSTNANASLYLKNSGTKTLSLVSIDITGNLKKDGVTKCFGNLNTTAFNCTSGCTGTLAPKRIQMIFIAINKSQCDISAGQYSINLDFKGDTATGTDFEFEAK